MKPLSSPLAFLGLAVAAILVVASCSTVSRISTNQLAELYIGDPNAIPPKYVKLKPGTTMQTLRDRLATLKATPGSICELTYLDHDGGTPVLHYCETFPARLKTDRVIKSAAATNVGTINSAANDPHLMYRVASPTSSDVFAVAGLLQ